MQNTSTQSITELLQKQQTLGIRILKNCRNELYRLFPYLDGAFAALSYEPSDQTAFLGTDGNVLYFSPEALLSAYTEGPVSIRRGYLHMLLHCLYLHILPDKRYETSLWNLACDMAVEQIIEYEKKTALQIIYAASDKLSQIRRICFSEMGSSVLSAEQIYDILAAPSGSRFSCSFEDMARAFSFDDHLLWNKNIPPEGTVCLRKKWEKLSAHFGQNHHGVSSGAGTANGTEEEEPGTLSKSRHDYRRFLKRFAVPREEVELDTESFDYISYTYGMEHYGNLPLIEPLEYKEGNKLEELVIAIDTSGSCSTETVRQFLSETYSIVEEKENFFKKMKVCIIQCDCCLQDVTVIHSQEEWKEYCQNIKIQGRAGTDFRPVFRCIEDLKKQKELRRLKALIYFTDGDGIYPTEKPDYETAFVFLKPTKAMEQVPSWAICLTAASVPDKFNCQPALLQ